jgi:ribokinase
MLRDLGELEDFGPKNFTESDYEIIKDADYTCLFNWAGTVKFGTTLAKTIFERAKKAKAKTYFDTADPLPNSKAIPDLIEKVLKTSLVDILSVNENEAIVYASFLDETFKLRQESRDQGGLALEAARLLAKRLDARIDLHTPLFSATLKGNNEVVVQTFRIRALRATGAGDAWDAGNILGDYYGLSDECRLTIANAVSACYLQDSQGQHPSREDIFSFFNSDVNAKFF